MTEAALSTTLFGQWLRHRRRSLDLTQTELARRVGCSVVTIRKIETGDRRPSREMAKLLAGIVGILPEEQTKFVQFARSDTDPEAFQHPLLHPPLADAESTELLAPEAMFALDFPGWISVTHTAAPEQLAQTLLLMRVQSAPSDSPRAETLADGRMLCKIYAQGRIAGHLEGTITQEITHMVKDPQRPDLPRYMTSLFSIETNLGTIKGCYGGFTVQARNGRDEQVRLHGQMISVTPAYIDLFGAEVFYEGGIYYPGIPDSNAAFERGILTILPR